MTSERTLDRLEELLTIKDQELETAHDDIRRLERQLEDGADWMVQAFYDKSEDTLPTPRIELFLTENSGNYQEQEVCLVLEHIGRDCSRVPLNYSKRSGGALDVESFPTSGELPSRFVSELPRLINDACFYMEKTGVPAYVVLDDDHRYRVTSLRPLVLVAVEAA